MRKRVHVSEKVRFAFSTQTGTSSAESPLTKQIENEDDAGPSSANPARRLQLPARSLSGKLPSMEAEIDCKLQSNFR
jgi:hypothetical protein